MRYFLYARKSSESEDRQVQSISDQLRELRAAAKEQGVRIVAELTESQSAKDPGTRPVFGEMLDRIERGDADGILCWSINRLSRNPIDSGRLSWLLQKSILKSIRTIDREYRPEDNVLLMAVESGVANQYILDLRKAVIRGMEGKAARGWFPNRPPQGYRIDPETKEIEPREPQFSLLRRAWELLLTGAYTVPQIRHELWKWGYSAESRRSKERRLFSESHLYRIFDKPFYYGVFTFRGQVFKGKHRPMVSKDEFDLGQRIIHGEIHVQPKRHDFPFTGLIRCGSCGCLVTAERKVKHYKGTNRTVVYEYYHCTRRRGRCTEPSVTGKEIESALASRLGEISIHPSFGDWLLNVIDRDFAEQERSDRTVDVEQDKALEAVERKLGRLIELRVSGEITAEEFVRHKLQYQEELNDRKTEGEKTRLRHSALRNAIRFGIEAKGRFQSEDTKLKRQIAQTFVSKCVLTQGRLRIEPHPLLALVAGLEPPKTPADMVGSRAMRPEIPVEWAWRDRILSQVADLDASILIDFAARPELEAA
jgi:site-specific DNA recombinase